MEMRVHCCRKYTILDVEMKRTVTSERTIDSRTIRVDVTLIQAEGEKTGIVETHLQILLLRNGHMC
jgi:hypothetical protein